jgi:hypothetical protein
MRKCIVLVFTALLLAAPGSSSAQLALPGCTRPNHLTAPFVFVAVNGQCVDLSSLVTPVAGVPGWTFATHLDLAGAVIDLHAVFDPDPSVTFGGKTVNTTGTTLTYAFLFGLPVVPDFYSSASSTLHLDVTSPSGTTTVANSATYPAFLSGYGTASEEATNLGVDLGVGTCVATGVAASTSCDLGTSMRDFAPTFFDNLEALVTYTQDNTLSSVTFSGDVTLEGASAVTTTPEPATLALVGFGLVAIGAACRRRQRLLH